MAFYKKQFNEEHGVWFPQAVVVGKPIETKQVADRLAKISTVSLADVLAVLAELPGVLADYMAQGKSVRLDGLGTFRYTLDTEGVEQEQDFDVQAQVKAVRVRFTPPARGRHHARLLGHPRPRPLGHRVAALRRPRSPRRGHRRGRHRRRRRHRLHGLTRRKKPRPGFTAGAGHRYLVSKKAL